MACQFSLQILEFCLVTLIIYSDIEYIHFCLPKFDSTFLCKIFVLHPQTVGHNCYSQFPERCVHLFSSQEISKIEGKTGYESVHWDLLLVCVSTVYPLFGCAL